MVYSDDLANMKYSLYMVYIFCDFCGLRLMLFGASSFHNKFVVVVFLPYTFTPLPSNYRHAYDNSCTQCVYFHRAM